MDVRGEWAGATVAPEVSGTGEPLPDLLSLSLEELRTIEHPVLQGVVDEVQDREGRSQWMLWGFDSVLL